MSNQFIMAYKIKRNETIKLNNHLHLQIYILFYYELKIFDINS